MQGHRQISYTKLKRNRGVPRLWMEALRLADIGFEPGVRYLVELDVVERQVRLKVAPNGDRRVSRRTLGDRVKPLIEVTGESLADVLGEGARVRAVLSPGEIVFALHPADRAREEREARMRAHVAVGMVSEATVCAGAGVSTWALAEGLESVGLKTVVEWVIDRDGRYLDVAVQNNPAITPETVLYEASLEEVDTAALKSVDIVQASLPCTGHSVAGKAKRGMSVAEAHPTDALAVYGLLRILEAVNPSVVVSENVVAAADSASYMLIKAYLVAQGYVIAERMLDGADAGTIEDRKRWWFVAVSRGLVGAFAESMAQLPEQPRPYVYLSDAMECICDSDPRWREYAYLDAKATRDAAAGKNFSRQLVTGVATRIGTVGRGYSKARSTEPFVSHEDGRQRLLTPVEHARVKGVPEELVAGVSCTLAHEVLGQSILFGHAVAIGGALAQHLKGVGEADAVKDVLDHEEDEGMKP